MRPRKAGSFLLATIFVIPVPQVSIPHVVNDTLAQFALLTTPRQITSANLLIERTEYSTGSHRSLTFSAAQTNYFWGSIGVKLDNGGTTSERVVTGAAIGFWQQPTRHTSNI